MKFIFTALFAYVAETLFMNIENQVCSLELSKRLKELGVKQESLFSWYHRRSCSIFSDAPEDEWVLWRTYENTPAKPAKDYNFERANKKASAFTAAELGEMIPLNHFNFLKCKYGYSSYYGTPFICDASDPSLSNLMAKILIYLIENNQIRQEVDEIPEHEIKIKDLEGIDKKAMHCLLAEGIETLGDLIKFKRQDLLKIPNFGPKSCRQVEEELAKHGLKLKEEI